MGEQVRVNGPDGPLGVIDKIPAPSDERVILHLADGHAVGIPGSAFTREADGSWRLPFRRADLDHSVGTVVPIVAEEVSITKRPVEAGRVRISKIVHDREEVISLPLKKERVEIRRIEVDKEVDGPQPNRQEGDTLIIPVVEEFLVIEKKFRVKEEIHITRHIYEETIGQAVQLKQEEVVVTRSDRGGATE